MKGILGRLSPFAQTGAARAGSAGTTTTAVREYTIDELARQAGTTVRNVRAYQDRGIIPPPERRGRAGVYNAEHLSRLRIIGQLLARGYTLSSIGELIEALDQGQNLAQVIGIESAVASPWTDEQPMTYSLPDLIKLFEGNFDPRVLATVVDLDILHQQGAKFVAPSPKMIIAAAELVKTGIPLADMLDVVSQLRANVERAAEAMVQLIDKHLLEKYGDGLPPPEESAEIGDLIWRLRPLVEMAVHAEVSRAMQRAATQHLGDRLSHVLEQFERARLQGAAKADSDDA
ncbi:MAG: MerR family transcriptional regulator [Gammaproteobacteria bacterium]|uniref:MerR family transcriptional regulator n=1 Tax=Nevskia sp. TaxID=1929292 RepID=UPI0040355BBE|nr:MerR family transcriptional regulator [Gammaproteobacteria bacterium]